MFTKHELRIIYRGLILGLETLSRKIYNLEMDEDYRDEQELSDWYAEQETLTQMKNRIRNLINEEILG